MGSQPTLNDSGQAPHSPRASVRKAVRQRPLSRTFEPNPQLAAIGSESPTDSAASSPSDNSGIRDKIAHVESKIRGSGEAPSPNTSRPGKPVLKSLAKGFGSIASSVKPFLSRDKSGSKENLQISTTSQPPSSTETQLCGSPVIGGATVHRRDGGRAPEPLARSNDAPPSPAADTSGTPNPKGTYGPRSKRRTSGGYGVGETVSGDFTWLRNPSVSSPATTKSLECLMSKDEAETGIPDSGSSAEGTPIDEEQNKRRLKRMSGMSRSPSVRERISRLEQVGDKSGCPTPPPLPKPSDGASVDSAKSSRKQPTLRGNR
ncbi:uncharacterized protein BJ171DRAFT_578363 [Polychytrium aggregatum]|uniref:uncharacterized protein n=1 Tax=Polychytrium aggregatum TaxID=110093 RepID=UPI0022FDBF64|nr:uncharacterized protein BJ171DRAFT_578363 [Polychytrium aggregatum]KAI9207887.1 hypothetical protein BJ171DRAFT_578363 [Polychytrium aggregatum]